MSLELLFSKDFIGPCLSCFPCMFNNYIVSGIRTQFLGGNFLSFCFTFGISLPPTFLFPILRSIPGMFPFLHFSYNLRPI